MSVGLTPLSLFNMFGNNVFLSAAISVRGNLGYGQKNPMQAIIPAQGENSGIPSSQGLWNLWQGSTPFSRMLTGGNPFHSQWNPGQGTGPIPVGSTWGNSSQSPLNVMHAQPSTYYFENQPMMSPQTQNPYDVHGHGFY
jgi:hypothetical protein